MIRRLPLLLLFALLALSSGCETGFIGAAARASLSSFLTEVATTAVNGTINP